jgi:hypothetical protein
VDPGQASRRAQAARLRAAQEREQRIAEALARLPEMAAAKRRNGDKPPGFDSPEAVRAPRLNEIKDLGAEIGKLL